MTEVKCRRKADISQSHRERCGADSSNSLCAPFGRRQHTPVPVRQALMFAYIFSEIRAAAHKETVHDSRAPLVESD